MRPILFTLTCAMIPLIASCDKGDMYSAKGRIRYDDGKPAVGVSVSDGFKVAVTDGRGFYELEACPDTRYIYFSYPSDAKVTADMNGLPEFFQRYEPGRHVYNFRLERAEVENEFALFALADPQAHYETRDTQTIPDTDRFRDEAVPAINHEISSVRARGIPCYGITLGDIVYSEKNRNSNPGLEIMREHFKALDMPVFQTMGNHDFTFFQVGEEISTEPGSSTINLVAQRTFEDCFGPVNYSFNRGDVHIVCMKDVDYLSTDKWHWDRYGCGFSKEQFEWLEADLANVSKDRMVILCVHIPLSGRASNPYVQDVMDLVRQYKGATVFSAHEHSYNGVEDTNGTGMFEYIHNSVCGQWWWSRIQGDGSPMGYTVYNIAGASIRDAYFIGIPEDMNTRDYQMRIYRGGLTYGGANGYFKASYTSRDILINVFFGDSRWKVSVFEDGVHTGDAILTEASSQWFHSVSPGEVKEVDEDSSQDWWAIGYHIGVCGRGLIGRSYYESNRHMWKYTLNNPSAKVHVEAADPYGNTYSCDEVITDGTAYPDYIKTPLSIFN